MCSYNIGNCKAILTGNTISKQYTAIESSEPDGLAFVRLDADLNIKSVHRFKNLRGSPMLHVQPDGGFYLAMNGFMTTGILHVNKDNFIDFKTQFLLWYFGGFIKGIATKEKADHLLFSISTLTADLGINNPAT